MTSKRPWQPIATAPEGELVDTCIDANMPSERNVQTMTRRGRLWFLKDKPMYVYYDPTHWRSTT